MSPVRIPPHALARLQESQGFMGATLELSSRIYGFMVSARNRAFDLKVLPSRQVPMKVISVGNIVMGGTGKTAIVRYLAASMSSCPAGIVTRGYGHRLTRLPHRVLPLDSAATIGDEPALLAGWLPSVPIVISPDRRRGALSLKNEVQLVILDDGFQHRWLHRDLDIVVVSPSCPQHLIPRGSLREPLSALRRADLIWIHDDGFSTHAPVQERRWTRDWTDSPEVLSQYRVVCLDRLSPVNVQERTRLSLVGLSQMRLHVLAAIARAERVRVLLQSLGAIVTGLIALADHHPLEPRVVREATREAARARAEALVVTEKDAIKILSWHKPEASARDLHMPILVLRVEVQVTDGENVLRSALGRVIDA